MIQQKALEQVKNLYEEYNRTQEYTLPKDLVNVFESYFKESPYDTWMWLQYAHIIDYPPYGNYQIALDYIRHALSFDLNNGYAWALLIYKLDALRGIDEQTYADLCKAKNDDAEHMALIELSKARYLEGNNDYENLEKALLKSIEYAPHFSRNFLKLGYFYGWSSDPLIKKRKEPLVQKGISNIVEVFLLNNEPYQRFIPLQEFFDGDITGTRIDEYSYKALVDYHD